ncbi:uncharacterized protein BCR38DRAFT_409645 [Pseudomassariella vexata]|uniref:Secreted protein n=1 Tax=Pseudomassariella vexata TaxID=1141098 RepID=A0A1Y2DYV0_9PEZI|nr:uncharacterized protein BCR38DRAFT_409645 [Pseudomassariella vexata]ORY64264.1 hypothetical protein BCR38DRAFT_409645 [Pseudomassariella vexata]
MSMWTAVILIVLVAGRPAPPVRGATRPVPATYRLLSVQQAPRLPSLAAGPDQRQHYQLRQRYHHPGAQVVEHPSGVILASFVGTRTLCPWNIVFSASAFLSDDRFILRFELLVLA